MEGNSKRRSPIRLLRHGVLIVTCASIPITPAVSHVESTFQNSWLGKSVVPRYEDFRFTTNGRVTAPTRLDVYRVEQVDGERLRLTGPQFDGWAAQSQVIPVEQAIAYFTQNIRSKPTDVFSYAMRANLWLEKNRFDRALWDCDEIIRIRPTYMWAYNQRAGIWLRREEYDKAIADYDKSIELYPIGSFSYINRGVAWLRKNEYDKAIADFNEAIRFDPNIAFTYSWRGNAFEKKGEYDEAIADYDKAIRLDSQDGFCYVKRGLIRHLKKDFDRASADYQEAVRIEPKLSSAYLARAYLWATCPDPKYRNGKKAVESATMACELTDWMRPVNLDTLAASYAELGDFNSAVKWQSKAIDLLSDDKKKEEYHTRLKLYQDKKPYRETFR
jgi:tetratricopeptide (TPR) repeat protein